MSSKFLTIVVAASCAVSIFAADMAAKQTGTFDAAKNTFALGTKCLVVAPNGTFRILNGNKEVANSYFSAYSPLSEWNTNNGLKITSAHNGKPMSVLSCKADPKAKTITVSGKLGMNQKGQPEEAYPWTRTFTQLPDGKIQIETFFDVPAKKLPSWRTGLFFNLKGVKNQTSVPVKRNHPQGWDFRTSDIFINTVDANDSFTIQVMNDMIIQKSKTYSSLYLTPGTLKSTFVIDLNKVVPNPKAKLCNGEK